MSYLMPSCSKKDQKAILDAIEKMFGISKGMAQQFVDDLGHEQACRVLHGMRRWYSNQTWAVARHIIEARPKLLTAMRLDPQDAVGAYRGFKVDVTSPLARTAVGDILRLPVSRNGGCSSWTLERHKANLFSGAGSGKIGLVVQLHSGTNCTPFIAPPSRSQGWFNDLYKATMGESFRFKEEEYAIQGSPLEVKVVAVKRR